MRICGGGGGGGGGTFPCHLLRTQNGKRMCVLQKDPRLQSAINAGGSNGDGGGGRRAAGSGGGRRAAGSGGGSYPPLSGRVLC